MCCAKLGNFRAARCLVRGESHEVDVIAQIEGVADDKGHLCAREHITALVNPVLTITVTDLKECIPCLALNVRTSPQALQVSVRPLVIGCPLERCHRVAIINKAVNIGAPSTLRLGFIGRGDVDFNGNGLTVDGNRCRVAHVLPFRFARGLYPRADS